VTDDTKIGGASGKFPATRWSAIQAARSKDPAEQSRALDAIVAAYWKPIYKYLRLRWGKSNEDAKDLTQEFFLRLVEKDYLKSFDPRKARLRTFLRLCVDRFVSNEAKAAKRLKRGGGAPHLPLDFAAAEKELKRAKAPVGSDSPEDALDEYFQKEFVRNLFTQSIEKLRQLCVERGKELHFRIFEAYDLNDEERGRLAYADLARKFGLTTDEVNNYLAFVRREFRDIALIKIRELTGSNNEFFQESRALFGVKPK
jgi:RNA polymerase sigma factor (sigma-70 family)